MPPNIAERAQKTFINEFLAFDYLSKLQSCPSANCPVDGCAHGGQGGGQHTVHGNVYGGVNTARMTRQCAALLGNNGASSKQGATNNALIGRQPAAAMTTLGSSLSASALSTSSPTPCAASPTSVQSA